MKTKIFKICTLFITLMALAGCMPDSLTKFKKETESKPVVNDSLTSVPLPDGEILQTSDITDITQFYYKGVSDSRQDIFNFPVGLQASISIFTNGTFGLSNEYKQALLKSCTISPALPFGVSLSQSGDTACQITGQTHEPSHSAGSPINYTVTLRTIGKHGVETVNTVSIGLGFFITPGSISYVQSDKLILKTQGATPEALDTISLNIDPLSQYSRDGFITSANGTIGVIKSVDPIGLKIGVSKVIPVTVSNLNNIVSYVGDANSNADVGLLETPILVCSSTGLAKVIRRPQAGNIFYLEVLNNTYFVLGQQIKKGAALCGTFSSTDPIVTTINLAQQFSSASANSVSNDIQYLNSFATIEAVENTYEIGVQLNNSPRTIAVTSSNPTSVSSTGNGVSYSVTPELPTGLSFSTTSGLITGTPQAVAISSIHTVTATNPIGSSSTVISLNTIYAPADLSYSTNQILSLSKISDFEENQTISELIQPPLTAESAKKAFIQNKLDSNNASVNGRYKLMVNATSGAFTKNSIFYVPHLSQDLLPRVISSAITPTSTTAASTPVVAHYNVAITLPAILPAHTVGGYLYTADGALAKITYKYDSSTKVLFAINIFEHNPTVPVNFKISDTLCYSLTRPTNFATCTSPSSITNLQANAYDIEIAAPGAIGNNFEALIDAKMTAANIQRINSNTFRLDEVTKYPYTGGAAPYPTPVNMRGLEISDAVTLGTDGDAGALGTINEIYSMSNSFIVERGLHNEIKPFLTSGSGVTFTISPPLPAGLTLNRSTGLISGTPTQRTNRLTYTISAINLVKKVDFPMDLEVRDYFKLENQSAVANSFFHKSGKYKGSRTCKINSSDILSKSQDASVLDISCFLDVEELDLYSEGLILKPTVGDSICNYVSYEPYSFFQLPPVTTAKIVNVITGCHLSASSIPESKDICDGDYTRLDSSAPNCDEGSYSLTVQNYALDSDAACVLNDTTSSIVQCGGKKGNCLKGAVTDALTGEQINLGMRRVSTPSFSGLTANKFEIPGGIKKGQATNLHSANGFVENLCSSKASDANILQAYANTGAAVATSPFAKASPYYSFYCQNGSGDTKARIRITVREWDSKFNLASFIDRDFPDTHLGVGNELYDKTGNDGFNVPYNAHYSWKQYTGTPASACTVPGLAPMAIGFPGLYY